WAKVHYHETAIGELRLRKCPLSVWRVDRANAGNLRIYRRVVVHKHFRCILYGARVPAMMSLRLSSKWVDLIVNSGTSLWLRSVIKIFKRRLGVCRHWRYARSAGEC